MIINGKQIHHEFNFAEYKWKANSFHKKTLCLSIGLVVKFKEKNK